jgi:hypothetical protein
LLGTVSSFLLAFGAVWAAYRISEIVSNIHDLHALNEKWSRVPGGVFVFILLGLLARGMSQLLRYMHDPDYRPQWLLRHGDTFLYIYGGLHIAQAALLFLASLDVVSHGRWWMALEFALVFLYAAAVGLITVTLGQLLKRLMPVIDEVRTLA